MKQLLETSLIATYEERIKSTYAISCEWMEWRCYEPGEMIYQQGFESPYLTFLVQGKVKIFAASTEGKQLIIAFNKPLELFGDIEFVQEVNTLHTIEAVTQVHCGILPLSAARNLRSEQDVNFKELLLKSISRKFLTKSTTLSFHLLHTAEVRLASYLLSISHDAEENIFRDHIPKQELKTISEFIGITIRHQNRCLQSLERKGIIGREANCIRIIDAEKLLEHAHQNIYEIQ